MNALNEKITDWRGRRVWLVGASSGIGAALAGHLRAQGATLALSARRTPQLAELAVGDDRVLAVDVDDADAVRSAHAELVEAWGEIDMLIYCAGVYRPMRAWEIDLPVVQQTLRTNLLGVYHLLDAVVPAMAERQAGGICLVASVAGYTGLPKALAYGPSKAALINLAQVLYTDLAPRGIGVYLVNPGFVSTRLTQQNDFTMPALITPTAAAQEIVRGLRAGRFEIHFPRRFTWWLRRLSRLPDRLRFSLLGKL